MSDAPAPPTSLRRVGKALWRDVVDVYGLTPSEQQLLTGVCATLDSIAALEEVVAKEGVTAVGSKGQTVVHPALQEARHQRLAFGRLLGQLALPDQDGGVVRTPEQVRAQRAGQARWRAQKRREGVA